MKNCKMCPLTLPTQVAGRGPSRPKLIVIGDYPNNEDEKTGLPFSGNSRDLEKESPNLIIKRVLASIGYNPLEEVYYAYALRCNPYHRKVPIKVTAEHLKACRQANLEQELAQVDCPIILAMGREAMQSLIPSIATPLAHSRGRWYNITIGSRERIVRVTFSPAQINRMSLWNVKEVGDKIVRVRRWNPIGSCGWLFQQDMRAVRDKLQELGLEPGVASS